jgi:hypothetical protein
MAPEWSRMGAALMRWVEKTDRVVDSVMSPTSSACKSFDMMPPVTVATGAMTLFHGLEVYVPPVRVCRETREEFTQKTASTSGSECLTNTFRY